jgi:hypothetical protein
MIVHDKTGGRTIQLFIPFEVGGKKIEAITFAPVRFGHTMRWADADWKSSFELLVELAGVEAAVIRDLRYPDADRVMEVFLSMLPSDIREDISHGRIPQKEPAEQPVTAPPQDDRQHDAPPHVNGGTPQGPGVPLPPAFDTQPGFDLSDEAP